MVSSSSNRSPSPMSTTPNPNPNSRTQQEREDWKSFTGYNLGNGKPSEIRKRASCSRDHEEKENGNLKPISRPPSPSNVKGVKNFMSPTISAASKINPSPRKKVLGERNDQIRTSASLSDGKFQFFCHENEANEESENLDTEFYHIQENNATEFSSEEKNAAEVNVGLADTDSTFPPYDPKTNFLSPRPRFLCYKPNPRIESYIKQGSRLEDQFAPETSSDIESSEETQSQNSSTEQEESFSSSSPSYYEGAKSKTDPRPRFFTKWKIVAFILVFLLGFVGFSVTYSPSFGNDVFRNVVVAKVYNNPHVVIDLAKANFIGVLQMIHNWREASTFGPVLYSNLTDWQEDEGYLVGDFESDFVFVKKDDVDYLVGDFELSYFVESDERQEASIDTHVEEQELFVEETNLAEVDDYKPEENCLPFLEDEMQSNPETKELEDVEEVYVLPPLEYVEDFMIEPEVPEMESNPEIEEEPKDGNSTIEGETDLQVEFQVEDNFEGSSSQILSTSEPLAEDDQSSMIIIKTEGIEEVVHEATPKNLQLVRSTPSIAATSMVVLCILTGVATTFMYLKKKKKNTSVSSAKVKSVRQKSVASVKERSCSGQEEVDNVMSEPCPSEMSSFHSKGEGRKGIDEAQSRSIERKTHNKRESLASSSSEYTVCSSYGSFTTYSVIPSKKKDVEVVTPVRRSSRIRSKVTSP